jgi:hypothetical protein
MIFKVAITRLAQKQLRKVPQHVKDNLMIWVMAVEHDGLEEVRKAPGYHDETVEGRSRRTAIHPAQPELQGHLRDQEGAGDLRVRRGSQQARLLKGHHAQDQGSEERSDEAA